jgi:hypothetical protein
MPPEPRHAEAHQVRGGFGLRAHASCSLPPPPRQLTGWGVSGMPARLARVSGRAANPTMTFGGSFPNAGPPLYTAIAGGEVGEHDRPVRREDAPIPGSRRGGCQTHRGPSSRCDTARSSRSMSSTADERLDPAQHAGRFTPALRVWFSSFARRGWVAACYLGGHSRTLAQAAPTCRYARRRLSRSAACKRLCPGAPVRRVPVLPRIRPRT